MGKNLNGRHFITLQDWTNDEIEHLLHVSADLKRRFHQQEDTEHLRNKTIFLIFFEASTRTRNSLEAGITQLGGHAHFLETDTMQMSHGEAAKDTAIILSRYGHAIACRNCFWETGNAYLEELAEWSTKPIINMQSDLYHPLQALADLMTMREKLKALSEQKVSVIWAYATTHKKPISVPLSQILLFPRFGMDLTLAYPKGYDLPQRAIAQAEDHASTHGGSLTITHDQEEAYQDAAVIIPKNWGSWVTDQSDRVVDDRLETNKDWKCTQRRVALARDDVIYMHALPADRENEVENEVIDGPHSAVYDEAENRLHTAKAVMALTMNSTYKWKQ
jgi:ornithine carbamoyltransferase